MKGENKMARKRKLPYLKKIGQTGSITIWLVDGSYIRTNTDEEFTNYGHHYNFNYIPKNEFWIDQGVQEKERKFFIEHLLTEYRMMERDVPYDEAHEAANKAERTNRRRAGDVRKVTGDNKLPDPEQVHVRLWKKLENSVSVWIVDGRLVRSVFDMDFSEGGHDYVYEFIPENELWIDNSLTDAERPYVLLHELHERNLMATGWDYDRAHEVSSKLEHYHRQHPDELHEALAKEGWE